MAVRWLLELLLGSIVLSQQVMGSMGSTLGFLGHIHPAAAGLPGLSGEQRSGCNVSVSPLNAADAVTSRTQRCPLQRKGIWGC